VLPISPRARQVEIGVVLERHADQIAHGVLRELRELLAAHLLGTLGWGGRVTAATESPLMTRAARNRDQDDPHVTVTEPSGAIFRCLILPGASTFVLLK